MECTEVTFISRMIRKKVGMRGRIAIQTAVSIVASIFLTSLMTALFVGIDPTGTLSVAQVWRIGLSIATITPALICPAVALRMSKLMGDLRTAHDELAKLAEKDTLTGLLNRRGFDAAAAKLFVEARRLDRPIAAMMCDIDMFKIINDEFGHDFGDVALKDVAEILQASIGDRSAVIGRQGGDEFAILLPGVDLAEAGEIGERLRDRCQAHVVARQDRAARMTLSVGIATDSSDQAQLQTLMSRADAALLQAKRGGRNLVVPDASILTLRGQLGRREIALN
jgi:diguanylate cyclase (GGDEF)-like protein